MVEQYQVYWFDLEPTKGSEINKQRPGVVISPNEMNKHLATVLVAPLTSTIKDYPYRVKCVVEGKKGSIALDQIRCLDKRRIVGKHIGELSKKEREKLKDILKEMLVD